MQGAGGCHWPPETSLQRGLAGPWDRLQAEVYADHRVPDRVHPFLRKVINPHFLIGGEVRPVWATRESSLRLSSCSCLGKPGLVEEGP